MMFRAVMDVLKAAEGPLTVRELVLRILAGKGEASPDLKTIRDLEGGVRGTLARKAGKTVQNVGQGMPSRWRIIN